jgi:PhzF family phenazine biosynthesis protein
MRINVKVIYAFSIQDHGGNPAGIVFDADELTSEQKQAIAKKLAFPETAFVSQSRIADYKLDFFTPTKQIPHCGHATIATFTYLKQKGAIKGEQSSKETIDGIRQIYFHDQHAYMEQRAPRFTALVEETHSILDSLNMSIEDLQAGLYPTIVNTGNSFLIIPAKSESTLAGLTPNLEKIAAISEQHGLIGYYLYAEPKSTNVHATTRMFAPYYGIQEEAATGMAAGPLASFLYLVVDKKSNHYVIEQGKFMNKPSPSLLHVDLKTANSTIQGLFVGGNAYVKEERNIKLECKYSKELQKPPSMHFKISNC